MSTTLSVRLDTDTKRRLETLAKRSRSSKSVPAAEAIAFVEAESWQLDEVQAGIKEKAASRRRGDRLQVIAVFHGRQKWPQH